MKWMLLLAALALPASAQPDPKYQITIVDVNGPPVPGVTGNEVTRYGSYGDWNLTGRLWKTYAPAFDYQDWDNAKPDEQYQKIVLAWQDKRIVLKSPHNAIESDPKAGDPKYLRKRQAFDALIADRMADKAKEKAERPLENEKIKTKGVFFGLAYFGALLFAVSLLWSGPLLACASRPLWLLPALVLSPLGWLSAVSLLLVRKWMLPVSVLAPLACLIPAKLLDAFSPARRRSWLLIAALLAYGLWSAKSAGRYLAYVAAAGSNEASTLADLSALRSALSVYYGDHDGAYPAGLERLAPRYIKDMPEVRAVSRDGRILHLPSSKVTVFKTREPDDRGGWGYIPATGTVFIDCAHPGLRDARPLSDY